MDTVRLRLDVDRAVVAPPSTSVAALVALLAAADGARSLPESWRVRFPFGRYVVAGTLRDAPALDRHAFGGLHPVDAPVAAFVTAGDLVEVETPSRRWMLAVQDELVDSNVDRPFVRDRQVETDIRQPPQRPLGRAASSYRPDPVTDERVVAGLHARVGLRRPELAVLAAVLDLDGQRRLLLELDGQADGMLESCRVRLHHHPSDRTATVRWYLPDVELAGRSDGWDVAAVAVEDLLGVNGYARQPGDRDAAVCWEHPCGASAQTFSRAPKKVLRSTSVSLATMSAPAPQRRR